MALEASRAQHSRDKTEMARRGLDVLTTAASRHNGENGGDTHNASTDEADEILDSYHQDNLPGILDQAFRFFDKSKTFFRTNEVGRGISVLFPFAGLILIGAIVVGPIEGWTFLEAVYFSVVSLTTVGFGDYVPSKLASIWFCILWLPFSVGFMSLFLGNIAAFYIRLSDKNIQRIERQMRRRLERAKQVADMERAQILKRAYRGQELEIAAAASGDNNLSEHGENNTEQRTASSIPAHHAQRLALQQVQEGFDMLPSGDPHHQNHNHGDNEFQSTSTSTSTSTTQLFGSAPPDSGSERRQRIQENHNANNAPSSSSSLEVDKTARRGSMQSMRDVVRAVRRNLSANPNDNPKDHHHMVGAGKSRDSEFMSIRSSQPMVVTNSNSTIMGSSILSSMTTTNLRREQQQAAANSSRKPSFALRVLVQERFAEIIATDIAGFQSSIEIKETTLSVTIDTLKETADKWLIPRRARKAFRAVAFETLYFVGEHGLITRGADALYDLTPFEFHGLFSPLLASMGDADTMERWLASTEILADVDLSSSSSSSSTSHWRGGRDDNHHAAGSSLSSSLSRQQQQQQPGGLR